MLSLLIRLCQCNITSNIRGLQEETKQSIYINKQFSDCFCFVYNNYIQYLETNELETNFSIKENMSSLKTLRPFFLLF